MGSKRKSVRHKTNTTVKKYRQSKTITPEEIIEGFRKGDNGIVREYFYGYCRVAYGVCDRRYSLSSKPGMDFFSLAHEYYLKLYEHEFRQLEDRSPNVNLLTWMVNGFRYLVLDRLKEVEKEHRNVSFEERMEHKDLGFDVTDDRFAEEFRNTIEELCRTRYGRDSKNAMILRMMFIDGFKGKEIAKQLGMTPPAVTQRYTKMMRETVIPYFKSNFKASDYMPSLVISNYDVQYSCDMREFMDYIRVTPQWIDTLDKNEIFVFGSNLAGMHGGGAAREAVLKFGAVMRQGVGLQGQSYAIPTMQGGVETIRPYADQFIDFAKAHPELHFLVTPIGCGIAGFEPEDIAPLFRQATDLDNVSLPLDFWECLGGAPTKDGSHTRSFNPFAKEDTTD